jgi:hypothetical protein
VSLVRVILLVGAVVLFVIDAAWHGEKAPPLKLTPLGLACLAASFLPWPA